MRCKTLYIYYKKKRLIIITISNKLYNLQNKEKKKLENLVNISQLIIEINITELTFFSFFNFVSIGINHIGFLLSISFSCS